jgi:hypothetical protein
VNDRSYDEVNLYKKHENKVSQECYKVSETLILSYCKGINENTKKRTQTNVQTNQIFLIDRSNILMISTKVVRYWKNDTVSCVTILEEYRLEDMSEEKIGNQGTWTVKNIQ